MTQTAVDRLHAHVQTTIGTDPGVWPGGWPDEIEAALIDAVFSIRARYGNREKGKETGVFGAVQRYRAHRDGERADDLRVLAATDVDTLKGITNAGRVSRRPKAEVVIEAAGALVEAGIVTAADFSEHESAARSAYLGVRGCGPVTWRYLRMLVGSDDVKPDTWVMRFVQDVAPEVRTSSEAAGLVTAVAERLGVEARTLDHAIWNYRRSNP